MPTISTFYGIIISMFYADHAPPHFHAQYAEFAGIIEIQRLAMIKGDLPKRALELTLDWAKLHQQELLNDWNLCQAKKTPQKIEPLK